MLLGEIVAKSGDDRDIVVDMEAGLEHLSRGTGRHVSRLLAVVEPYYRSLETARRACELARELEIGDVAVIANKLRDDADREAIRQFCAAHELRIAAEVPSDTALLDAERGGRCPIDYAPTSPAVAAIRRLAESLLEIQ